MVGALVRATTTRSPCAAARSRAWGRWPTRRKATSGAATSGSKLRGRSRKNDVESDCCISSNRPRRELTNGEEGETRSGPEGLRQGIQGEGARDRPQGKPHGAAGARQVRDLPPHVLSLARSRPRDARVGRAAGRTEGAQAVRAAPDHPRGSRGGDPPAVHLSRPDSGKECL